MRVPLRDSAVGPAPGPACRGVAPAARSSLGTSGAATPAVIVLPAGEGVGGSSGSAEARGACAGAGRHGAGRAVGSLARKPVDVKLECLGQKAVRLGAGCRGALRAAEAVLLPCAPQVPP